MQAELMYDKKRIFAALQKIRKVIKNKLCQPITKLKSRIESQRYYNH